MAYPPNTNPQYNDSLEDTVKKILRLLGFGSSPSSASAGTPITSGTTASSAAITAGQRIIQNHSTSPVNVSLGGTASATVLNFVLPACAVARDGTSPVFTVTYSGAITFYSAATLNLSVTTLS